MFQLKITSKKLEGYQKNDKFVTGKTKICLFVYLFYEINTKLSVDSFHFSSYPFRKSPGQEKKMMQHRNRANMPQSCSQF